MQSESSSESLIGPTNAEASLTFTVQPLLDYPPQQRAAVVAEGGRLVVVDVELVRDVDAESLVCGLQGHIIV